MEPTSPYKIEDFVDPKFIADGTFSKVFRVTHAPTGKTYALKKANKEVLMTLKVQDKDTYEYLDGIDLAHREADVIKVLKDCPDMAPNFPEFVFGFEDDNYIYLFLELSEIGPPLDFDHQLARYRPNPLFEPYRLPYLRQSFLQMARGLAGLHDLKVAHMDIKVENFLVFSGPNNTIKVKLIDFNSCRIFPKKCSLTSNQYGSLFYLPPEYYESLEGYSPFQADVYALGVVWFIMATTELPYTATKDPENEPFQDVVYEGNITEQEVNLEGFRQPFRSLLAQMLAKDPTQRPTISEAIARLEVLDPAEPLVVSQSV